MLSKQFIALFLCMESDSLDRILHREFSHSADANRQGKNSILQESWPPSSRRLWRRRHYQGTLAIFHKVWGKGLGRLDGSGGGRNWPLKSRANRFVHVGGFGIERKLGTGTLPL